MSKTPDPLKRFKLFHKQRGKCYYCGEPMFIRFRDGGRAMPDECTLEHLDSRLSPDRGKVPGQRIVAAHDKCNTHKNVMDHKALTREELVERSTRKKIAEISPKVVLPT